MCSYVNNLSQLYFYPLVIVIVISTASIGVNIFASFAVKSSQNIRIFPRSPSNTNFIIHSFIVYRFVVEFSAYFVIRHDHWRISWAQLLLHRWNGRRYLCMFSETKNAKSYFAKVFTHIFCVFTSQQYERFYETLITCDWHLYPKTSQNAMIFLLTIAKKPNNLNVAGIIPLNMNTYIVVGRSPQWQYHGDLVLRSY